MAQYLFRTIIQEWKKALSYTEEFSLTELFCSETELLQWSTEGLPTDQLSRENAIIINNV